MATNPRSAQPAPAAATQPTPMRFFQTMLAYQQTAALVAAIDLDIFTAIAQGNHTAETVAAACQASTRGTRSLCDALVVLGFLQKHDKKYSLAPDSAMFLDRNSRTYVGTAAQFLGMRDLRQNFDSLADAVRYPRPDQHASTASFRMIGQASIIFSTRCDPAGNVPGNVPASSSVMHSDRIGHPMATATAVGMASA